MSTKTVVLGVTGGIAAYKAADLVSRLRKRKISVHVIMTEHAERFISSLTFESLSGNPVACDMFDRKSHWEMEHISLAKKADLFAVVPATANVIGKIANGIADDMLSTTVMATKAPILLAPAMNTVMYESEAVQHNLETLRKRGVVIVEPEEGLLACGDTGKGKLASMDLIEEAIFFELLRQEYKALFEGKKILVTAGPTVEPLDPVRYISNYSSGKMGYAFADCAAKMGAQVILLSGPTKLNTPYAVRRIDIRTTMQLMEECLKHSDADYIIMAAAPADFTPRTVSEHKIKSKENGDQDVLLMEFRVNPDILAALGSRKRPGQVILAFAAETDDVISQSMKKMKRKNADYILVNDVTLPGAGFDVDTNIATLISSDGCKTDFPLMSKYALAENVLLILGGGKKLQEGK